MPSQAAHGSHSAADETYGARSWDRLAGLGLMKFQNEAPSCEQDDTPMPSRLPGSAPCVSRHDPDDRRDDGGDEEQHHDDSEHERDVRYEVVALERGHAEEYERGSRCRQDGVR